MELDSLFWEIMGLESNEEKPLSFRYFGAWTCPCVAVRSTTLEFARDACVKLADEIVRWSTPALEAACSRLTLDEFSTLVESEPVQGHSAKFATRIGAQILRGDTEGARTQCRDAAARGWGGGLYERRSFVECAAENGSHRMRTENGSSAARRLKQVGSRDRRR